MNPKADVRKVESTGLAECLASCVTPLRRMDDFRAGCRVQTAQNARLVDA